MKAAHECSPNPLQPTQVDLLAAKKRKKAKSSYYIISTSAEHLSRDDPEFAAKLRANFVGTNFTIFDNGISPSKADDEEATGTHLREELGAVIYVRRGGGGGGQARNLFPRKPTCWGSRDRGK
jgi:tubby-related protein 1